MGYRTKRPNNDLRMGYSKLGGGIPCPRCGESTLCRDTFWATHLNGTGRRRVCRVCNFNFYTVETVVEKKPVLCQN